jgi:hypothetical protein
MHLNLPSSIELTETRPLPTRASEPPALWWIAFISMMAVVLFPLLVVDIPPLLDYPNHLARMYVLAFGRTDPVISRMYAENWGIIPDLGIDMLMPPMLRILPIYVAGRVILGLEILLTVVGCIVYSRVAFGRWSLWPLASALVAYNATFLLGFVNFGLSLGMALLVAAGWMALRVRHPVLAVIATAILATAVFFTHIMGCVFLAVLIGSDEANELYERLRAGKASMRYLASRAVAVGLVFLPAAILYMPSGLHGTHSVDKWLHRADSATPWIWLTEKVAGLVQPFMNYYPRLDRVTGLVVIFFIYVCLRHRLGVIDRRAAIAFFTLTAAYFITPFFAKNTAFVDSRFIIMAGMLLFCGFIPLPSKFVSIAAMLLPLLIAVRIALLAVVWYDHNSDVMEVRQAINPIEPGSRVLAVSVSPSTAPNYWERNFYKGRFVPGLFRTEIHIAALALIERRAFWPQLFTESSQKPFRVPITTRPPYRSLSAPAGDSPDLQMLTWKDPVGEFAYLKDWQNKFDYVLVLDAGGAPHLDQFLPEQLQLLTQSDMAALFRIRRPKQITQ